MYVRMCVRARVCVFVCVCLWVSVGVGVCYQDADGGNGKVLCVETDAGITKGYGGRRPPTQS